MAEKQKNKRGEGRQYSRRTVLIALASILAIPFLFASFYFFRAYPLAEYYFYLSIVVAIGLTIILVIFLIKGISIAQNPVDKWILGLAILGILGGVVSKIVFLFAWLSIIIEPVMLTILVIYCSFVLLRHQAVNLPKMMKILGIGIIITNVALTTLVYFNHQYQLHDSMRINNKSYHLMTDSGFLDSSLIRFYECNSIGMMCEAVYAPRDNYDAWSDDFSLEAIDETHIRVLVNEEEVYQHPLN